MEQIELLTPSDASRESNGNMTPAAFVAAADAGHLEVAARTPRGNRLFTREAVRRFLERRKRQASEARAQ